MSIEKAVKTLRRAAQYLSEKSYLSDLAMEKGLSYATWSRDISQSVRYLEEAEYAVTHIVEPVTPEDELADLVDEADELYDQHPIGFDDVPVYFDIESGPNVLIVAEVDLKALEIQVLKDTIKDSEIVATLPFTAAVRSGQHFFHITNESAYPIETGVHTITQGMALCGRYNGDPLGPRMWGAGDAYTFAVPTCPGCIAKGRNLSAKSVWHYLHRRDHN